MATDRNRCGGTNWWPFIVPQPAGGITHCRDAQSYGKMIDAIRIRDAGGRQAATDLCVRRGWRRQPEGGAAIAPGDS